MKKSEPSLSIPTNEDDTPIMMKMPGELIFTKNGKWMHDGQAVTHQGVARYFSQHLTYSEELSSWIVEVDGKCVPAKVEDTPQVITNIHLDRSGSKMTLSSGASEPIDLSSLLVSKDGVWYLAEIEGCRYRLLRNVVQSLMPYVEQKNDAFILGIFGRSFTIASEE